jgi:hypothetical protein
VELPYICTSSSKFLVATDPRRGTPYLPPPNGADWTERDMRTEVESTVCRPSAGSQPQDDDRRADAFRLGRRTYVTPRRPPDAPWRAAPSQCSDSEICPQY